MLHRRRALWLLLLGAVLAATGGFGLWFYLWRPYHFLVVKPGVLYRSGQLSRSSLEWVHDRTGIRTIIDLVEEKRDDPQVLDERAFAEEKSIRYVHLPLPHADQGLEKAVERFLAVMDDPQNQPALLHCWQGVKRTGIMVAIFRMEYERVGNAEALEGFSTFGRDPTRFQPVDRDFIANYVPRWRRAQQNAGARVDAAPVAR